MGCFLGQSQHVSLIHGRYRSLRGHSAARGERLQRVETRPSSGGNYVGLTVTVRAQSREQLDDIYRALTGHPMVKVVL